MTKYQKIDILMEHINELIEDTLGNYDTEDLELIIMWLLQSHILTSKDSINNLIIELENYKEEL